jgi:hypothetical protein
MRMFALLNCFFCDIHSKYYEEMEYGFDMDLLITLSQLHVWYVKRSEWKA